MDIRLGGNAVVPPPPAEYLLLEDGDRIILEDGSGFILI